MSEFRSRVLLADDDSLSREFLTEALESMGAEVLAVDDGQAAIKQIRKQSFDLVMTDLKMPRQDGMAVIRAVREAGARMPVVLVTAHGTVDVAIQALREGADDVLVKPVAPDQMQLLLERLHKRNRLIAENDYLKDRQQESMTFVTESPRMKAIEALMDKLVGSASTILITGESGVGKEVIASELHRRVPGDSGPFVKINCAAIPETLMESELFGHEAGAFTGATTSKLGKFELADGGTLLLDEIGEIPLRLQAKLLRVLEDGIVQRVGGNREIRVKARILAATNRDLGEAVRKGHFRQDLYYRLHILPIQIPPLRQRREEILPLAEHFLAGFAAERGMSAPHLGECAKTLLQGYDWPGNVRELRNLVQRAFLLCEEEGITEELIGSWIQSAEEVPPGADDLSQYRPNQDPISPLVGRKLRDVEDSLILATLDHEQGNRTKAAAILGVSPRTLYNRLHQMEASARSKTVV